jgi:hypothetical protein
VLADATGEDRRYALANGCYSLRSPAGFVAKDGAGYSAAAQSGAETFRMQATDLGSYLFYGRDRDFMAATAPVGGIVGGGAVQPAAEASPAADWRVDVAGDAFTMTLRLRTRRSASRQGGS